MNKIDLGRNLEALKLLIDEAILRNCRNNKRNLASGFIDYKKTC